MYESLVIFGGTVGSWAAFAAADAAKKYYSGKGLLSRFNDSQYLGSHGNISNLAGRAKVQEGTSIEMVEYDLAPQDDIFGSRWGRTFRKWLDRGASLDVFVQGAPEESVQGVHPVSVDLVRRLQERYDGLRVYNSHGMPEEVLPKDFHFTLFHNPDQLWLERHHPQNSPEFQNCNYDPKIKDGRVQDFKKLQELVDSLRVHGQRVDLRTVH